MASDAQESGPLPGTGPSAKFTQGLWITHFGQNAGIVGDTDGTAFSLTKPPATDFVEIGSATIDSVCKVGGFPLRIPAGETQSLEIPPSLTGGTVGRTDLIVARLNTGTFTTSPGPVRLVRIAGTEGSADLPSHNTTLPSPVDLVLYQITRKQGQGLNQAIVVDRRPRTGWHYLVPAGAPLPQTAPLGSTATRDGVRWRRDFVGEAVDWVVESVPVRRLTGSSFTFGAAFPGWSQEATQRLVLGADGVSLWVHIEVTKSGGQIVVPDSGSLGDNTNLLTLNAEWKPQVPVSGSAYVTSDAAVERNAGARINATGVVQVTSAQPGASVRKVTADFYYSLATA